MNVRLKCDMHFSAAVYYDDQFRINHYTLGLWMTTNDADSASQNIAFERIKYFVNQELDSTVFINQANEEQCKRFVAAGLNVTTLPTEPVDQIVGIMLYYKLNAIMEQSMIIVETELSSLLGDSIVYLHSESENVPDIVQPDWWTSADLVHCDLDFLQHDKIVNMPQATVWRDLDLAWPENTVNTETGNIVVFADFKNNETK